MAKRGGDAERWEGGYKRRRADGRHVYVIYARRGGKLYEISTRCTSSSAAEEHWRRFQSNPAGYRPEGETPAEALTLSTELGAAFLTYSRDAKGNTPKWVRTQKVALAWWQERLKGADLRTVATARLVRELDAVKSGRKQLIATLKALYGWLRKERHAITTAQDPMLGQIRVPQAKAAQLTRSKAVSLDDYQAALKKLKGWQRDAMIVLGATGWHVTELERFAAAGEIVKHPLRKTPVLVCPRAKRGNVFRTEVGKNAASSARKLIGNPDVNYFALRRALQQIGATWSQPGFMRHSVSTWAVDAGADPSAVSAFLNHVSAQTTKKFYATHATPKKVPTLSEG